MKERWLKIKVNSMVGEIRGLENIKLIRRLNTVVFFYLKNKNI